MSIRVYLIPRCELDTTQMTSDAASGTRGTRAFLITGLHGLRKDSRDPPRYGGIKRCLGRVAAAAVLWTDSAILGRRLSGTGFARKQHLR